MARTMKKFSAGGAQGRYDRRMADIEKDYKKAMARKTGKDAEVAEAKRQQRIADAKDDLAKRTGADRTATRAAERLAESNLTKTRKYGAAKSVTKDPGPVANITETLSVPKMDSSIGAKPAVKKEADKPKPKPAATTPKRMGDQGFAYKKKDMPTTGQGVSTHYRYVRGGSRSGAAADGTAAKRLEAKGLKTDSKATGATSAALLAPKGSSSRSGSFGDLFKTSDSFRASQERKYGRRTPTISGTDTDAFITYGDAAAKKNAANKAKGGKIMKYAKGGKVKKMAVGGMSTMPPAATNTAPPAANTAARPTTTTSVAPPAANTAARPYVGPGMSATTQGTDAERRANNAQAILQAKYSSATPNRDGSNTNTYTKDAAGNVIGVQTNKNFDRNQSLRDFSTVSSNFLKQGVPLKEITRASGELRKLQMDNRSTPAQHQAAIQSILARMNSLVPKKAAKGGSMKAANKSGRALVKKSADTEGRAMKKFAAGGLTSGHKAANGVAKKGLTKGKQVKMNKGGACYAKGGSVRGIDGIATKGKTRCKGARK